MMLAAVPDSVDAAKVAGFLRARPGVQEVHDLHIWSMSTTETALTAHLVMPSGYPGDVTMDAISAELKADLRHPSQHAANRDGHHAARVLPASRPRLKGQAAAISAVNSQAETAAANDSGRSRPRCASSCEAAQPRAASAPYSSPAYRAVLR